MGYGVRPSDPRIWPVSKSNEYREPKLNRREAFQAAASAMMDRHIRELIMVQPSLRLEIRQLPWGRRRKATVTYTRVRALYVAKEDFTLRISRRNIFTRLAEVFGFYGLLIGDQELERKYTIKSSNEPRVRSLMMDRHIRELIMVQPSLRLEIRQLPWGRRRKPTAPVGEAAKDGGRGPGGCGADHGCDQGLRSVLRTTCCSWQRHSTSS